MFSTVNGFGDGGPRPAPWGYGGPGLSGWIDTQLAEEHVMLMGATTYRQLPEIVATLAGTTVIDEPLVLLDYRVGVHRPSRT